MGCNIIRVACLFCWFYFFVWLNLLDILNCINVNEIGKIAHFQMNIFLSIISPKMKEFSRILMNQITSFCSIFLRKNIIIMPNVQKQFAFPNLFKKNKWNEIPVSCTEQIISKIPIWNDFINIWIIALSISH